MGCRNRYPVPGRLRVFGISDLQSGRPSACLVGVVCPFLDDAFEIVLTGDLEEIHAAALNRFDQSHA